MFMGAGIELLYKPFEWPIGIGGNLYFVKKRAYANWGGTQKYQSTTGFLSLFWASPFYNFDFGFHYGYYLAKDTGYTIEAKRRFTSGWELGVFATKTNVSAQDFGEGSYDKGFSLKIPFQPILKRPSRGSYSTIVRPIQRDAGARLENYSSTLWNSLRNNNKEILEETKERSYE